MELLKKDREWANDVKNRDGWACVICGNKDKPNAHHILVRERHSYKYEVDNGITLCVLHHLFSRHISAHNASLPFYTWLAANRPEQFEIATERSLKIIENESV